MGANKALPLCNDTNQRVRPSDWVLRLGRRINKALMMCMALCMLYGSRVSATELSDSVSVSGNDAVSSIVLLNESASSNNTIDSVIYDSYEEFMESPLYVTRYENEVLNKLEFIQYALAIIIASLFLLIFKKK